MKALQQYFPVVLFIILYKGILTFESLAAIFVCDHSREMVPFVTSNKVA